MNAFELLKADHEKVSGIFERIDDAGDGDTGVRRSLFAQVKSELEAHAHIEETIFYPALRQEAETQEIVLEAIEEHQEVKDLLAEIEGIPVDSDDWSDKVTELKEAVEHHVGEEEGEMFDKARDVLSQQQIEELGNRMESEKMRKAASAA
jgi:hemerythrin superfamily protein